MLKQSYANLLEGKKKFKMAIIAIARKLLIYLNSQMAKFLGKPIDA